MTDRSSDMAPPVRPRESHTRELTLLLVEDDQLSSRMLQMRIEGRFRTVYSAADGEEGFNLYCQHRPDIVLTDHMMPKMTGLGLMRKIRAMGLGTPVILMTVYLDNKTLIEAINVGIDRFVPKPFDFELIFRILGDVAREIINERLLEQHRLREMELLRYRDAYNSIQQESATRKERHVVRHDLRNLALTGAEGTRWGINVAYAPRDIMCGDGYSVRDLYDGRQLVFVIDAMGSGMSASITTMLATSFFNYQVENIHLWGTFTLRHFLDRFREYLACMLLDDEVVSCGFCLVDLAGELIETAFFGLPPLLVRSIDGQVQRVRSENPPLGTYSGSYRTTASSLAGVADLMIMTDGVTDAPLAGGGSYRDILVDDFRMAPTLAALQRLFREHTEQGESDDLTLLHLRRLDLPPHWSWRGEPVLTLAGLHRLVTEFLDALDAEEKLGADIRDELEVVLGEALVNALEHGCFGIDRDEKTRLQLHGGYDDSLEKRIAAPDAKITLSAILWRGAGRPLLVLEVKDSGPGLPVDALSMSTDTSAVNGRGLKMIGRYSDSRFIGGPGGGLILLKSLEGGGPDGY